MRFSAVTAVNPLFGFVGDLGLFMPHGHGATLMEGSLLTFDAGMGCLGHMLIILPFSGIQVSGCVEVGI